MRFVALLIQIERVDVKIKLPLCFLTNHHPIEAYWGAYV
jgi:hypothetical protein